jgi:hypothetical protein
VRINPIYKVGSLHKRNNRQAFKHAQALREGPRIGNIALSIAVIGNTPPLT